MKVLIWNADTSGCFQYRIRIPFTFLNKYDIEYTIIPELPNSVTEPDLKELCELVCQYDAVIVQRCYKYHIVKRIRDACSVLGKPLIFETDDDYINLPPHNPCFQEIAQPGVLSSYVEVLRMADLVTVSTQELKDVLYRFNKNIEVLPNNLEMIYCGEEGPPRRGVTAVMLDEHGEVSIAPNHGLATIPAFMDMQIDTNKIRRKRNIRVGYTGTPTHTKDFLTIKYSLEKIVERYKKDITLVFVGSDDFIKMMTRGVGRMIQVPITDYFLYMYQIRNFDIGIAPLEPNVFNMSKSDLKPMEYATWGIPSVLPEYITYSRSFKNGENCLMYQNSRQFEEALITYIENEEIRIKHGTSARDYIRDNRLERQHSRKRYDLLVKTIDSTPKLREYSE